ncbi:MAG: bifunctional aldolase/short-chain dehydrogenase [Acidimicrobiales bacterium]|nr:bifunctional aldolase/short-chain dehydrogenase [Acidimicrobiales bacterium]
MENRWNHSFAKTLENSLDECVYGSRLIGSDPALVLHGGGNTSIKAPFDDITGKSVDALFVKGSGWDLATIERQGFAPLNLSRLQDLLALDSLSDPEMMRELAASSFDPGAPAPSVESLLHAYIPHPAVLHSHADVVVSITNTANGEEFIRSIFGDSVIVIPYVMPGFELAKMVASIWPTQAQDHTVGMVLLNHGLFSFGRTTAEAYARHHELISKAEHWLDECAPIETTTVNDLPRVDKLALADLRKKISDSAKQPMIVCRHTDPLSTRFVQRTDLASLATRGPLTPDHVIRTKRVPMIGNNIDAYERAYIEYFKHFEERGGKNLEMLDPAPRVVVDSDLGVLTAGRTISESDVTFDIYNHTMSVLERAEDHLGGYVALEPADIFDVEYWDLEQAKLRLAGPPPALAGTVAVVTGAASGIGRACAARLLAKGCAVCGIDIDRSVETSFDTPAWLGLNVDVTDALAQIVALEKAVDRFGGVDIVIPAAGIFGVVAPISQIDATNFRSVQAVNVDSVVNLLQAVYPLLTRSPIGGRVAIIGSKNVAAPGQGAVAYSASKASLAQVGRIAALEWAEDGIRVNTVHPDSVFDTGLWTDELLEERAAKYGLTVEAYKSRNLLKTEITAAQVATLAVELCTDTFAKTTGAQVPVDGGNDRVI